MISSGSIVSDVQNGWGSEKREDEEDKASFMRTIARGSSSSTVTPLSELEGETEGLRLGCRWASGTYLPSCLGWPRMVGSRLPLVSKVSRGGKEEVWCLWHPGAEILLFWSLFAVGASGMVASDASVCSMDDLVCAGTSGGPSSAFPGTPSPKKPGGWRGGSSCGEVAWVTSATSRAALTVVMCRTRLCATSRVVRCRLTLVGRHRHFVRAAWLKPWKWMPVVSATRRRISAWVAAMSSAAIWVGTLARVGIEAEHLPDSAVY